MRQGAGPSSLAARRNSSTGSDLWQPWIAQSGYRLRWREQAGLDLMNVPKTAPRKFRDGVRES